MEKSCAKKTTTKSVFMSGVTVTINGKFHTRMYTEQEKEALRNLPSVSAERSKEIEKHVSRILKEMSPDFHRKVYPQEYKK